LHDIDIAVVLVDVVFVKHPVEVLFWVDHVHVVHDLREGRVAVPVSDREAEVGLIVLPLATGQVWEPRAVL